jgi:MFS family permease
MSMDRTESFFAGVLSTQFVNSALHLAQPLLIAQLTGSLAHAAFFSSFDTAVHMGGTFFGGWPTDRFGAKKVLIFATFLRACVLAAIPVSMALGCLTVKSAMIWYTLDACVRGFVDTAQYALPFELADHDTIQLDRINSRFEIAFDFGGIAGPLALGALMLGAKGIVPHLIIPLGFILSSAIFLFIPASKTQRKYQRLLTQNRLASRGTWAGFRHMIRNRSLLIACVGLASFNIYPLRKLMSAFFAKSILHTPAAAGTIGSAFGLGGILGALLYSRQKSDGLSGLWILAGACGMLTLAWGWMPASLGCMAIAALVFAATNVGARLALTGFRQKFTPSEINGGVTSASRFMSNGISVGAKALVGTAFALGAGPRAGFTWVALSLSVLAAGQLVLASKLFKKSTAPLVFQGHEG